jgi:hypothetical protein
VPHQDWISGNLVTPLTAFLEHFCHHVKNPQLLKSNKQCKNKIKIQQKQEPWKGRDTYSSRIAQAPAKIRGMKEHRIAQPTLGALRK